VLANQAGATMTEIIGAVKRVSEIIGEIAQASAEQSGGIDQIALAVSQMDAVTQQNAALVEQASAAAQSLESQAESLRLSVAVFRVAEQASGEPA
jgi:methyl-accepting chemotaxis protein-1 (serine sensor receptor)